ncbi:MAG: universal stress protein [Pseudomonadales bacterium]|nr:universal stress protein [Pseudomonadales bacterium]
MFANILVVADQLESKKTALRKAALLCQGVKARITVLRFLSEARAYTKSDLDREYVTLKEQCADLSKMGSVSVDVVVAKDIADWVLSFCKKGDFDLLIKTGHRSETDFYTPTDWKLIRLAPCSVLIAGQKQWKKNPVILGSLDVKSEKPVQVALNKKVIATMASYSAFLPAKMHVVSCIPVAKPLLELDITDLSAKEQKHSAMYHQKIDNLLQSANFDHAKIHVRAGLVEKVISHCAHTIKADLVLVGSIGRKGAKGFLLGNTAERLLRFIASDVLVLRP